MRCFYFITVALAQQNPPVWPSTVKVFGPGDPGIQAAVDAAYATNGGKQDHGQFSTSNYAFLFKPGTYTEDVPVGFYTQVVGLGDSPDDVIFVGSKGVYCEEGDSQFSIGALDTFWRSAENFRSTSSYNWFGGSYGMLWAVSQAAPLRRVHVDTNLVLFQYESGDAAGFASGGYMSNSVVEGQVTSGSQQQWFTRNSRVGGWLQGVWNMVFVGVDSAPSNHCGTDGGIPVVTAPETPAIAEKPYITIDGDGLYYLNIPAVRFDSVGVEWSAAAKVGFDQVFVAREGDSAATINSKLKEGMHVVFSAGTYIFQESIEVTHPDTVLLGLGLPILVSGAGKPVISVGNVDGVRVAGVLLEAGPVKSSTLLQWGDGGYGGNAMNPGVLSDVFARSGGPNRFPQVETETMITVATGNVIGDNLWLWRADHTDAGHTTPADNPCSHGALIEGNDVIMYGLAVEHTLQDLTIWSGNRGQAYFYQSELPYGVTQQQWGDKGYVGYRVADTVTEHQAFGVGVYHYFRDYPVVAHTGIQAPASLASSFHSPLVVFLNGYGTVEHVINDYGTSTHSNGQGGAVVATWCGGAPAPPPPPPPTPTPTPSGSCNVGDVVQCPGKTTNCAGNQCCPDNSVCPSADDSWDMCTYPKMYDCTTGLTWVV